MAYYDKFGYDRPVYTLSHDMLSVGLTNNFFRRTGFIPASRENAAEALASDGLVVACPGGDHDAMRPTSVQNVIDFRGRTGYVKTAIEAGVPIVPTVSIGGQEIKLYLTRGTWLAQRLCLKKLLRSDLFPVSVGFPFGLSIGTMNVPLPSKIVTEVLPPMDIAKTFGKKTGCRHSRHPYPRSHADRAGPACQRTSVSDSRLTEQWRPLLVGDYQSVLDGIIVRAAIGQGRAE